MAPSGCECVAYVRLDSDLQLYPHNGTCGSSMPLECVSNVLVAAIADGTIDSLDGKTCCVDQDRLAFEEENDVLLEFTAYSRDETFDIDAWFLSRLYRFTGGLETSVVFEPTTDPHVTDIDVFVYKKRDGTNNNSFVVLLEIVEYMSAVLTDDLAITFVGAEKAILGSEGASVIVNMTEAIIIGLAVMCFVFLALGFRYRISSALRSAERDEERALIEGGGTTSSMFSSVVGGGRYMNDRVPWGTNGEGEPNEAGALSMRRPSFMDRLASMSEPEAIHANIEVHGLWGPGDETRDRKESYVNPLLFLGDDTFNLPSAIEKEDEVDDEAMFKDIMKLMKGDIPDEIQASIRAVCATSGTNDHAETSTSASNGATPVHAILDYADEAHVNESDRYMLKAIFERVDRDECKSVLRKMLPKIRNIRRPSLDEGHGERFKTNVEAVMKLLVFRRPLQD